ncbi:WD40 repeat-like protein [Leucogyrophana mollusca]|uniref:WD40 repeat-like protein n=1 Tax=Leucogyrophana mollusca TaxID=85980 RepID=A0ACB8AXP7_9AGAM|nr:WD40 repeat-like protein [Leucogyrophana mollusca]
MSLKHTLTYHTKSIACIAISPDGQLLVSSATDARAAVWNIQTGTLLQQINCSFNGPVSAVIWLTATMSFTLDAFVLGCADGSLHVYERTSENSLFAFVCVTMAHRGAVESLDWDPRHERIASAGDGSPQVWSLQGQRTLMALIASPPKQPYIARTVKFVDDGASLIVCYLESHQIECYTVEPWSLKWAKPILTRIGYAIVDGEHLVVSNLANGIDRYRIPTMERTQNIPHAIVTNRPLQLSVVRQAAWLVSGGDDGSARIYDTYSGRFLEHLKHGDRMYPSLSVQSCRQLTPVLAGTMVQIVDVSCVVPPKLRSEVSLGASQSTHLHNRHRLLRCRSFEH